MLEYGTKDNYTKMVMITELLDMLPVSNTLEASSSSSTTPRPVTRRVQPPIQRLTLIEKPSLDAFDEMNLCKMIVADSAERHSRKMAAKGARLKLKVKLLEMLGNLEKIVLDLQAAKIMSQADAEVLAATHEKLKKRQYNILQAQKTLQVQSKIHQGPCIGLFFKRRISTKPIKLLTSLLPQMKAVRLVLFCEEPGHEHIVHGAQGGIEFGGMLGGRLEKFQPLLASGLQVVARAMSPLAAQLSGLDPVTLPILGEDSWNMRAIDLEKHAMQSKTSFEDEVNVQALKMDFEDFAAEWLLSNLVHNGVNIFKLFGLLRVGYTLTEEGNCPRYTQSTFAWLCNDHHNQGLEAGTLESYPLQIYYNLKYDQQHEEITGTRIYHRSRF